MLAEIHTHVRRRESFAFETTLAGRGYAPLIRRWRKDGYVVSLMFLSLPEVEVAIGRVRARVAQGGHDLPESVIRRRFTAGLRNFHLLYKSLADRWTLYDNSGSAPKLIEESPWR